MKLFKIALAAALALATPAFAADMATKAAPLPFITANGSGWYLGAGTEAALAASSVSGSNFPGLTSSNFYAAGATVGVDVGYIWGNCFAGTWCQVEVDGKYQNIGGSTATGSVQSLWSMSQEFDVGASLFQTLFAAVGNLGTNFPTFNPTQLLPSAVAVAATPRQYFGIVLQESEVSGTFGSADGQTWNVAFGPKTGYRWQTLGTNGQPNDGSLNIYAEILFANRGADLTGVFSAPGKAPLAVTGAAEMSTMYLAGIHYDFGIPGR